LYTLVYQYEIPKEKGIDYVNLEKQAMKVYLELGCLKVELYRDVRDPRRWMEVNKFEDSDQYGEASSAIREDPRIVELRNSFTGLLRSDNYKPARRIYYQML